MYSITIMGAYGAKSEKGGSSAFYLNEKNVIDAGNILKYLKEKNTELEIIWLTHSHLDHIVDIAYILDNYYENRKKPLKLCGLPETLNSIRTHFLNHEIWPDFSQIPLKNSKEMTVIYEPIALGTSYKINDHTYIEAFKTDHTVPSCGYVFTQKDHSLLISADTHDLTSVIQAIREKEHIKSMVIECSFPSSMSELAVNSKHLTPTFLFEYLRPLENQDITLHINHMKPAYEVEIVEEIREKKGNWDVVILKDGDKIIF